MRMSIDEMHAEIEALESEMARTADDDRKYNLKCDIAELRDAIAIFSEE